MCDPGYSPDTTFFHLATSCVLPANALLYLFIETLILNFLCAGLTIVRVRSSKAEARKLLGNVLLILIGALLIPMGEYFQGGAYEVAVVGIVFQVIMTSHLAKMLLHLALQPALSISPGVAEELQRMLSFWHHFNISWNIALCLCGIILIVFARQSSDEFNSAMIAFILIINLGFLVLPIGVCVSLRRLETVIRQVESSAPAAASAGAGMRRERLSEFARRLLVLRYLVIVFSIVNMPLLIVISIVYLALDTFPFAWIILVLLVQSGPSIALFILIFLRVAKRKTDATSIKTSTTANNAVVVKHDDVQDNARDSLRRSARPSQN